MNARQTSSQKEGVAFRRSGARQVFLQKKRLPRRRVQFVRRETGALIGRHRPVIVGQHFERQLAAADFRRPAFRPIEQSLRDALPAAIAMHDDIVDVEQGFRGEG